MAHDASELAGLQKEDEEITGQYEYAKTRAASLLTLEGDMKYELQELSAKQLSIIDQIKNITANETAARAVETESAAAEGEGGEGEEAGKDSMDPDAPNAGDEPGAAEKERGRVPMLAERETARHLPAHQVRLKEEARRQLMTNPTPLARREVARDDGDLKGPALKIPASQNTDTRVPTLKIPAATRREGGGHTAVDGGGGSVAARVARAGMRAAKSAAKVGSLLEEAKNDVEQQSAVRRQARQQQARKNRIVLEHALELQHELQQHALTLALKQQHELQQHEALLRREEHARGVFFRKEEHAHRQHEEARKPAQLLRTESRVRHTGAP